jgi:hypothetical protein
MENKTKGITAMLFATVLIAGVFALIPSVAAAPGDPNADIPKIVATPSVAASPGDDYYTYSTYSPTGQSGLGACGGYVDADDNEYFYYWTDYSVSSPAGMAYKVQVETAGDPNMHPDNPENTGPIAPRTFTEINSHDCIGDMGVSFYVCDADEFYVDDTGIYLGPGTDGIHKWDHDWNYIGKIGPELFAAQSLAYDSDTKIWYAGLAWSWTGTWPPTDWSHWDYSQRDIAALADTDNDGDYMDESWVLAFTTPGYAGGHHDGMEYVKPNMWISDMTSDKIAQWRQLSGVWTEVEVFDYTEAAVVEGMGFGPNKHFWISGFFSNYIYEIGGGALQVAVEGIPDQEICAGESFDTFDLDDYAVGTAPFTWTYSGNVGLGVSIDADNVVTVTYSSGWLGSETITFTVTDATSQSADDDATFTVKTCGGVTVESALASGVLENTFLIGQSVYAIGSGYAATTTYDLYIVEDTTWPDGKTIPARVAGTKTSVLTDGDGNIAAGTLIWNSCAEGKYDIVVDVNGNGDYDAGTDALDSNVEVGFEGIPEFSTIAIPVASILGLLFFFNYRKRRREQ